MIIEGLTEFSRLIEALRPSLGSILIAGGWAHRLHRLTPMARQVNYAPITTDDADIVVARDHSGAAPALRQALIDRGFSEDFSGDDQPPVTYYQLGAESQGFYAEFLTPLTGGGYRRDGTPDVTAKIRGVNAQKLRHLDLLLIEPWTVEIGPQHGFDLAGPARVMVPNAVSFVVQKLLIHTDRKPEKRPGDVLYIHDTIELFSGSLAQLAGIWQERVSVKLSRKALREVREMSSRSFDAVNDTIREAARLDPMRALDPVQVQRRCRAGLDALLPS
jgi:hypothetical protein